MLFILMSLATEFMIISESIIEEISLGGAAFRSLIWTILFGAMLWAEIKYQPREIPVNHWLRSPKFHYVVVAIVGLVFLINLILTLALTIAAFTV